MTVDDYIDSLPEDRRIAIRAVREAVNSKLPPGYEEGIVYDMISWFVPWTRLAETYNNQPLCVASLGAQKNHMALYLMSVYGDDKLQAWFEKAYKASGKKLDMGKSCVRFKKLDDLALDVIGDAIAKVPVDTFVARYEEARANTAGGKKAAGAAKAVAEKAKGKASEIAAKAKAAIGKAQGKAKAALVKAEGRAATKAKHTAGKAKAALAKAEGQAATKAKHTAGKAKAALAKAEGQAATKAKQAAAKARGALANAKAKAKAKAPGKRAST